VGGGSAPSLAGTIELQEDEEVMLRIGVAGLGAIGQEHLSIYRRLPGVHVSALADVNQGLATGLAAHSSASVFASTVDMLAAGAVDAISLCTPDHLHYADSLAAIEAGVHLLVEKPIAADIEQADALVRAAEASQLVVMPGHTLRFHSHYLTARNAYASGAIGEAIHGYLRRNNKKEVADRVQGRVPVSFFLGVHDIDVLTWIVGEPVIAVQAMESWQRSDDGRQAVAVVANLRLKSGGVVQLESAWGLPNGFPTEIDARLRLVGSVGELSIDIHDQGMRVFDGLLNYPAPSATELYGTPQGALYEELAAFVRCVLSGSQPPVSMREAAESVRVAVAIDRAVASGAVEQVR
jgi:predicted dehydrogenase